ncbi:hypothetical protein [Dyella lutea]|uniref:Uncharacterized protein n=1 Tax=Dyella lutea TaxID=2950441 RepID=A0ABT1FHY1_9GAMM|nr:hypothetical protein [Dyella lutea]MCP1375797.1 hypothetical protein [Dyella lutea]
MREDLLVVLDAISGEAAKWPGLLSLALAVFSLLVIARLSILDFGHCYRLVRGLRRGGAGAGMHSVLASLLLLAFTDGALTKRDRRTLVRRTRLRMEHELFDPMPDFRWPLPDDHPDRGVPEFAPERGRRGRRLARRAHHARLRQWRAQMRRFVAKEGDWTIYLDNPAQINARMAEVQRYFDILRGEGIEEGYRDHFLCAVEVSSGFIAPLHLLTGLLVEFNDKWGPILRAFDRDAMDYEGIAMGEASLDLRQIQMFIYNCWLLWGPSIPICGCRQWDARYRLLQYGFGDENNSIEVVGEAAAIAAQLHKLAHAEVDYDRACRSNGENDAQSRPLEAMAVPANVLGQLRLSGSLHSEDGRRVNALPKAARASWGGGQDERPVLFISGIESEASIKGSLKREERRYGRIALDDAAMPSRYYSAYLWVGFVLLGRAGDAWRPLSEILGKSSQRWKDFVPFFEHGNLADRESCAFGKRQLAAKTVAAFSRLVEGHPPGEFRHRFAFACAIDEPGCGYPLAHPEWGGGPSMRELIKQALRQSAERGDPNGRRLLEENILQFDHFDGRPGHHDYAACQLPTLVAAHYATFDD